MFGIDDAAAATLAVGGLGFLGQQMTNSANQANAEAQTDFQERMSNSAYQRQVKDLEAAGLNPMLAYIKGGGASTPPGAMATYQSPVSGAVQAATSAKGPAEIRKIDAETNRTVAEIDNVISDTALKVAQTGKTDADSRLVNEMIRKTTAEISRIGADIDKTEAETENLVIDRGRIRATIANLAASSALMAQQGMTEVARRSNLAAATNKLVVDGKITKAEYDAMERTGFVGVTAREVKVVSDVSSEWVDKFLPWKRGASTTHQSESIIRDSEGRVTGRDTYRSTRPR